MIGWSGWKTMASSAASIVANLVGQDIVARSISLTQATGQIAIQLVTGARLKLGTGTTDYLTSDGATKLTAAGALGVVGDFDVAGGINILGATPGVIRYPVGGSQYINLQAAGGFDFDPGAGLVNRLLRDTSLDGSLTLSSYTDDSATSGNRTVNNVRGKNAIAIGAATCVITNSFVTANSQVLCTLEFNDVTAVYVKSVIPAAGSFTITVAAAATAATKFSWTVIN